AGLCSGPAGACARGLLHRDVQRTAAAVGLDADAPAGRHGDGRVADVDLPGVRRIHQGGADELGRVDRGARVDADVVGHVDRRRAVDHPAALAVVLGTDGAKVVELRGQGDLRGVTAGSGAAGGARVARAADAQLDVDRRRGLRVQE